MDRIKDAMRWMKATHGRLVLAPLTGQDSRAWGAFVLLLDLYAVGDNTGRREAVAALAHCIRAAQSHTCQVFLNVVPFVVDGREGAQLAARIALMLEDLGDAPRTRGEVLVDERTSLAEVLDEASTNEGRASGRTYGRDCGSDARLRGAPTDAADVFCTLPEGHAGACRSRNRSWAR